MQAKVEEAAGLAKLAGRDRAGYGRRAAAEFATKGVAASKLPSCRRGMNKNW